MDEFLTWARYQSPVGFSKMLVQQYKSMLLEKHLAPSTINQRLAAVRRLAFEAADNGLLDPNIAAAIGRVHGVRSCGVRLGHWLGREDVERLLQVPGGESARALRDGAILALLFGGGLRRSLRRSEVAALTVEQFRTIDRFLGPVWNRDRADATMLPGEIHDHPAIFNTDSGNAGNGPNKATASVLGPNEVDR
jgi:site-specific recombinase XerD